MSDSEKRGFKLGKGRPGFSEWVGSQSGSQWPNLPLTHITKGVTAEDILRGGSVDPSQCTVFDEPLTYFFYARPAYRVSGDAGIRAEALCPFCFIFSPELIQQAVAIHAFDTGALAARMYNDVFPDEVTPSDFSLDGIESINRLITTMFGSIEKYLDGDLHWTESNRPETKAYEFHAKAYVDLILSTGRNEPDDRVFTIEVLLNKPVSLADLKAIVMPHTLCVEVGGAPWLDEVKKNGVDIVPYTFFPGRPPEHYHTLLEQAVRTYYRDKNIIDG